MIWLCGVLIVLAIISAVNVMWDIDSIGPESYTGSHSSYVWEEMQKFKNEMNKVVDKPERIQYAKKVSFTEGRKFREIGNGSHNT